LLIALAHAPFPEEFWAIAGSLNEPAAGSFVHDMF
jgi:hypothetical protein